MLLLTMVKYPRIVSYQRFFKHGDRKSDEYQEETHWHDVRKECIVVNLRAGSEEIMETQLEAIRSYSPQGHIRIESITLLRGHSWECLFQPLAREMTPAEVYTLLEKRVARRNKHYPPTYIEGSPQEVARKIRK